MPSKKLKYPPADESVLRRLWDFHKLGAESIRRHPGPMPLEQIQKVAREYAMHPEMVRKARQLAASYSRSDLEKLESLGRRHGHCLGLTHLIRLMTVPKGQRETLQRQAIHEGWGAKKLNSEIIKRFGSRMPSAGRHHPPPADVKEAHFRLAQYCDQWRRLSSSLRSPVDDPEDRQRYVWARLRPSVRKQIKQVDEVLAKLGKVVGKRPE